MTTGELATATAWVKPDAITVVNELGPKLGPKVTPHVAKVIARLTRGAA